MRRAFWPAHMVVLFLVQSLHGQLDPQRAIAGQWTGSANLTNDSENLVCRYSGDMSSVTLNIAIANDGVTAAGSLRIRIAAEPNSGCPPLSKDYVWGGSVSGTRLTADLAGGHRMSLSSTTSNLQGSLTWTGDAPDEALAIGFVGPAGRLVLTRLNGRLVLHRQTTRSDGARPSGSPPPEGSASAPAPPSAGTGQPAGDAAAATSPRPAVSKVDERDHQTETQQSSPAPGGGCYGFWFDISSMIMDARVGFGPFRSLAECDRKRQDLESALRTEIAQAGNRPGWGVSRKGNRLTWDIRSNGCRTVEELSGERSPWWCDSDATVEDLIALSIEYDGHYRGECSTVPPDCAADESSSAVESDAHRERAPRIPTRVPDE